MVRRWRLTGHFPILYDPPSSIDHHGDASPAVGLTGVSSLPLLLQERVFRAAVFSAHRSDLGQLLAAAAVRTSTKPLFNKSITQILALSVNTLFNTLYTVGAHRRGGRALAG
jgi:hypothetical protein